MREQSRNFIEAKSRMLISAPLGPERLSRQSTGKGKEDKKCLRVDENVCQVDYRGDQWPDDLPAGGGPRERDAAAGRFRGWTEAPVVVPI